MAERSAGLPRGTFPPFAPDPLLARYAAHADPRDLEALVLRHRPLAIGLARRYAGRRHAMDDLAQVACVGLIKALQRFDPERRCSFATFAVPTILGELRRFCRDAGSSLHVPRGMQEKMVAVRRAGEAVTAAQGRTATVAEVATALGWDPETVLEALLADSTRSTIPLESERGESGDPCQLLDLLGEEDPGFELVDALAALEGSVGALTRAEQRVLRLRFEEDLGLHEIASRLALPHGHVARLLASALRTLRRELGVPDTGDGPPRERRDRRPQRHRRRPALAPARIAA